VQIARSSGIRVIGPNCNGVVNTENKLTTSFAPTAKLREGKIGYISQSGALSGALTMLAETSPEPVGFNKLGHVGNMCDVSNIDLLKYMGEDEHIQAIGMYVESINEGEEFLKLARGITEQKPVFILKVGRSQMGCQAAMSHTGALSGSDRIYEQAIRQCGAVRVQTVEELVDSVKAAAYLSYAPGNRLAILTNAGGPGIIAMDEVALNTEVLLAELQPTTKKLLKECLPPMAMICRPEGYIDMTAAALEKEHSRAMEIIMEDSGVDALVLISASPTFLSPEKVAAEIIRVAERFHKPVAVCLMHGEKMYKARKMLETNQIPTYDTPDRAARAMVNLIKAGSRREERRAVRSHAEVGLNEHEIVKKAYQEGRNLLETEARELLSRYRIPVVPGELIQSAGEAIKEAEKLGYPVVLKVVSPQIIHKSDCGGVQLGIAGAGELEDAYERIRQNVCLNNPQAEIKGMLVVPFMQDGVEVIIGAVRDPQFGPVFMFGLGGVFVEIFNDVSFHIGPVGEDEAWEMVRSVSSFSLLQGARGSKPKDVKGIVRMLIRVSQLFYDNPLIKELDLNPVLVKEDSLWVQYHYLKRKGEKRT